MEVNKIKFSSFLQAKENNKTSGNVFELKNSAQSPLKAQEAQGRALLNIKIPFKGFGMFSSEASDAEMSEAEFETLKIQFYDIVQKLPENIKSRAENWILTKANINTALKIVNKRELLENTDFLNSAFSILINTETAGQKTIIDTILDNEKLHTGSIFQNAPDIMSRSAKPCQVSIAMRFLNDENLYGSENIPAWISAVLYYANTPEKASAAHKILDSGLYADSNFRSYAAAPLILASSQKEKLPVIDRIISILAGSGKKTDKLVFMRNISRLLDECTSPKKTELINKMLSSEEIYSSAAFMPNMQALYAEIQSPLQAQTAEKIIFNETLRENERFMKEHAPRIINSIIGANQAAADKILSSENLYKNQDILDNAAFIIKACSSKEKTDIALKFLSNEKLYESKEYIKDLPYILLFCKTPEQLGILDNIMSNADIYLNKNFMEQAGLLVSWGKSRHDAEEIQKMLDGREMMLNEILLFIKERDEELKKAVQKLNKLIGRKRTAEFSADALNIALKFYAVHDIKSIEEIPQSRKREFMRNLLSCNADLFAVSGEIGSLYPILPKNQEEYCSMLPLIIRSLGINGKVLNAEENSKFGRDLEKLAQIMSNISDEDFQNLDIKQEYPKNDFIQDALDITKRLNEDEKSRVFDYFGFELIKNKNAAYKTENLTGYSISGYPSVLNDDDKLNLISSWKIKDAIETLKPYVLKFSENNRVMCKNNELEEVLNGILHAAPELHSALGNIQAGMNGTKGAHTMDIFSHSLKVLQGIVQNPDFSNLNASDKKIMLLAALFHDITKQEGCTDSMHADKSSFDTLFISKRFNLTNEEEIKLYTLIKSHEWLGYVCKAADDLETEKRQQSAAYDLRHDNLFEMSLIFTKADLKGVSPSFYELHNKDADKHAACIKTYIEELKKTQPLLPVTKIPKADVIAKASGVPDADGRTDIPGVYIDKDGLVIIKYNELENKDLEKIGFPKGSLVKGIKAANSLGDNIDTGNIKFFVHGLEYPNQLAKFDAFSIADSDVLLSASWAERAESKYRFFRTQGVILDCSTKYVHGGGKTDSGSGCGKHISDFKKDYIFGGKRQSDRAFISDLIKNTLNFNDEEYIRFVKANENKPLSEIEPEETRIKLIQAFAGIASTVRTSNREYNEMYISNPKPPMAVFAYSSIFNEKIKNPIEFLNRDEILETETESVKKRTDFLRKYAIEHNIPFVIFGG